MPILYRPAKPMPPGYRSYTDVVQEIAKAEGLVSTGFHYGYEPDAAEIERVARVHFRAPADTLHLRKIVSDDPSSPGWLLFRASPNTDGERS